MDEFVPLDHSRFTRAERAIFTSRLAPDCMSHSCKLVDEDDRLKLDACCQYGVDVDVGERDRILEHEVHIRGIMRAEVSDHVWFHDTVHEDVDFPSGKYVRTTRYDDGCIFLSHEMRGCAIHRASIEAGWSFDGVKPHVCRLFPLSYDNDSICMSDDYRDYSCAYEANTPTVYRVQRETLTAVFGPELVVALDAAEALVTGVRRLPLSSIRNNG